MTKLCWLEAAVTHRARSGAGLLVLLALFAWDTSASAGIPSWLKSLANTPAGDYPEDTAAVILLDEQTTAVQDDGEIRTRYRRAYRILEPEGRSYATLPVFFDSETRLTFLRAWSMTAGGKDYEAKEKDAVETSLFNEGLYHDTRSKVIHIPGAEAGTVIGYEYEQRGRPYVLQDQWWISRELPVRLARYTLDLPSGWEMKADWVHHSAQQPRDLGENRWVWELRDVAAVEQEPAMPSWKALASRLLLSFFPADARLSGKSLSSWSDVAQWYAQLAHDRRQSTPEIRDKVAELTADSDELIDRIAALAAFVQQEVRYVAIEIGIGGYQPHAASQIFANRYGDCKDKATLLQTMLSEIGVDSHYVLINTNRGTVAPTAPSAHSFNHVIVAIRIPDESLLTKPYSVREHEMLGRLLFFDPTDPTTPLGELPPQLQASVGLVVSADDGKLVELPTLPPIANRLLRKGEFVVSADGMLGGVVNEVRWGQSGDSRRNVLLNAPETERQKVLENFLGSFLGGVRLLGAGIDNLEEHDKPLAITFRFEAAQYAKKAGNLFLVRPCVLGYKASDLWTAKERKHPLELGATSTQTDTYEIRLPEGFEVDELPPAVSVENEFVAYQSSVKVEEGNVIYARRFDIKKLVVPANQVGELDEVRRKIRADERGQVVLKQSEP